MPPENRELVYCHSCEDEWYRDESGLVCPSCQSDIVEIIEANSDPRTEEPVPELFQHPLHDHNPWDTTAPDPDEEDISQTTFRSGTQSGQSPPRQAPPGDFFGGLLNTLIGAGFPQPGQPPNQAHTHQETRTGNTFSSTTSVSFSMSTGPNGYRFERRSTAGAPNDDLVGILGHLMNSMGPPGEQRGPSEGTLNPIFSVLMGMGGMPGRHGDVAYTEDAFNQIVDRIREQHGGAEGAPPASDEIIGALPRIKVCKEHLDDEGKATCPICLDSVNIGDEVVQLPCDHWYMEECITAWLKQHDTCPQCRHSITPKEGDQNQPRTRGQVPRNWQINGGDLENILRTSSQDQGGEPTGDQAESSSRNQSSEGGSALRSVADVANNIVRRFTANRRADNQTAEAAADTANNQPQ